MRDGWLPPQVWNDWQNAELYQEFVDEYDIYRQLNRILIEVAEIEHARRVLDLGCGTGATTTACLAYLHPDAQILGVDAARAMVEVARARIADPRARFEVAAAGLADELDETFDRVLCNAAFWLFPDRSAVLEDLGRCVLRDGIFAFDVPAERMLDADVDPHPFQRALATTIAAAGGRAPVERSGQIDPMELEGQLEQAGFVLEKRFRHDYLTCQKELMELMEIPAMLARTAAHLRPEVRAKALASARQMTDPDREVRVPWDFFVARRAQPQA